MVLDKWYPFAQDYSSQLQHSLLVKPNQPLEVEIPLEDKQASQVSLAQFPIQG